MESGDVPSGTEALSTPSTEAPVMSEETLQRQQQMLDALIDAEEAAQVAEQIREFEDKDKRNLFKMIFALGLLGKQSGSGR